MFATSADAGHSAGLRGSQTVFDGLPRPGSIDAVVFDIGGVLLDWNPRYLYRRLFDDEGEMERFLAEVCTMEWHAAHDRGVPFSRSSAELAAAHPEHAELIAAWGARSEEMVAGELTEVVALLAALKRAGVPCYALTNMEAETFPLRRDRYGFFGWFDGVVVSAYERIAKPDPEIFVRLLGRFGLCAQRTVLIDDSAANVEAARGVGMQAVQFRSAAQLRAWLTAAGLLAGERGGDGAVRPS
jgi:2-haloacid dehalogenase